MTAKILKGQGRKDKSHTPDMYEETGGVVHKRVVDAREKAARIVVDAEGEATNIRGEAEGVLADAKKRREDELRRGYAEGESKGLAKVTEKLLELERLRERFYEGVEPEVIKLAMSIAEKVIGKLAAENQDMIKIVVRQALERTLGDRIVIRLNPEDHRAMMAEGCDFRESLDRTKRLTFREDESISRGGCIVESEVGTIDAQLELQLDAIRKALEI